MINERSAHIFCKDDISKIENYEKAIADTTQTWLIHHRLELTLDGQEVHTPETLKRLDMYYHRPYFELIFLTRSEHTQLHKKGMSAETKRKLSEAKKGRKLKPFTEEHKQKISEAAKRMSDETKRKMAESRKGKHHSEATRRRISEAVKGNQNMKGKHHTAEAKRRMSDARKRYWARRHDEFG